MRAQCKNMTNSLLHRNPRVHAFQQRTPLLLGRNPRHFLQQGTLFFGSPKVHLVWVQHLRKVSQRVVNPFLQGSLDLPFKGSCLAETVSVCQLPGPEKKKKTTGLASHPSPCGEYPQNRQKFSTNLCFHEPRSFSDQAVILLDPVLCLHSAATIQRSGALHRAADRVKLAPHPLLCARLDSSTQTAT